MSDASCPYVSLDVLYSSSAGEFQHLLTVFSNVFTKYSILSVFMYCEVLVNLNQV